MEQYFRIRRLSLPKRSAELVAILAVSCALCLFLHTQSLTSRLREMEDKLQPLALSANDIIDNTIYADTHRNNIEIMYKYLKTSGQMHSLRSEELNNTRKAGIQILFFNRVPKVGSQTFMELIRRLSIHNKFDFNRDAVQRIETIRLAPDQQHQLVNMITELPSPSVYIKHVCYTNFTKFSLESPIYINMVRDPIERVISWYYYVRAPWYYVERKQAFPDLPLPDPVWLRKDFETCVLRHDRECTYTIGESHEGIGDHRRQSLFFCGHDPDCTPFNTIGALEKAKHAVDSQYAVVGVLEDLNTTLVVLEKYIPKFFNGAVDIYYDESNNFNRINHNSFKPPVSEYVKDIVRRNFTREIEFYQFCKQRLHKQYLAINLQL